MYCVRKVRLVASYSTSCISTLIICFDHDILFVVDLSYLFLTHDENTTATTSVDEDENHLINMSLSVSTIYLIGLTGIFVVTALMHLTEAYCLLHGIWYLLCLPAGNIILLIYSLCNITDRSWGKKTKRFGEKSIVHTKPMNIYFSKYVKPAKLENLCAISSVF